MHIYFTSQKAEIIQKSHNAYVRLKSDVTVEPRSHRRLRAHVVPASALLRLVGAVFVSANEGRAAVLTRTGRGSDFQTLHCPRRVVVCNVNILSVTTTTTTIVV